jgi:hypothetical protein
MMFHVQCVMPVFDGLFPPAQQDSILTLLYSLADWHSLAKLYYQSDTTLAQLSLATQILGAEIRHFAKVVCPAFKTKETQAELRKRVKQAANASRGLTLAANNTRLEKTFNLKTYKLHTLGHYVDDARLYGPIPLFSTQAVRHLIELRCCPLTHSFSSRVKSSINTKNSNILGQTRTVLRRR